MKFPEIEKPKDVKLNSIYIPERGDIRTCAVPECMNTSDKMRFINSFCAICNDVKERMDES